MGDRLESSARAGLHDRLGATLGELRHGLSALLWPTQCAVCGAPDRDCCPECLAELCRGAGGARWVRTAAGPTVCVAGPYAGAPRALIVALKHGGRTGFARHLGASLRAPLCAALSLARGPDPPIVVTAPSRAARVRERGYRHVELLVRAALRDPIHFGTWLGDPPIDRSRGVGGGRVAGGRVTGAVAAAEALLLPNALRALPGRRAQVGLDPGARLRNAELVDVRRRMRSTLRGREVVLVDDVVTTGATVAAAGRALQAVEAQVIGTAALCVVERGDSGSLGVSRNAAQDAAEE